MTIVAALALVVAARCGVGEEFVPRLCPTGLPAIAALAIERQGFARRRRAADEPPCAAFRIGGRDVRRFFRGARQADQSDVHHTLPESACAAQGSVRFADGSGGRWQIDRSALGWLDRPGHPRMTLYCLACQRRPWLQ